MSRDPTDDTRDDPPAPDARAERRPPGSADGEAAPERRPLFRRRPPADGDGDARPPRPAKRPLFRRRPASGESVAMDSPAPAAPTQDGPAPTEAAQVPAAFDPTPGPPLTPPPTPDAVTTGLHDPPPAADETAVLPPGRIGGQPATTEEPSPGQPEVVASDIRPRRPPARGQLRRERRRLQARRESAVHHLGGLAFELHRRDLLAEPVMRLRAAEVAEIDESVRAIDARLDEMERLRLERRGRAPRAVEPPPAGHCHTCSTPYLTQANFCSNCGTALALVEVAPETEGREIVPGPAVEVDRR